MKSSISIGVLLFLFLLFQPITTIAQNIKVFNFIGKPLSSVVNEYGKPAHQDKSNPEMECVFYKTPTLQLVFVTNTKGIFQAEATKGYGSKSLAIKDLDEIISSSINHGFVSDTLSTTEFQIHQEGVSAEICLFENVGSQKFEVRVKAKGH